VRTRHRSLGFATETRLPALVRSPGVLSHRGARPKDGFAGSSPASAMGRAPLVDFCNPINPRARPSNRPNPAHRPGGRPPVQLLSRVATLGPADASFRLRSPERGQSRVHGSGASARVRLAPALPRHLPPRSLAGGALPQPDRPGHLTSHTRDAAGWSLPRRRVVQCTAHIYEHARRCAAYAALRLPGPPYASLREEQHAPPHPRCLPSSDKPRPGSDQPPPQPVPSLWSGGSSAFSIFERPPP
jgi:hypothetical protein